MAGIELDHKGPVTYNKALSTVKVEVLKKTNTHISSILSYLLSPLAESLDYEGHEDRFDSFSLLYP